MISHHDDDHDDQQEEIFNALSPLQLIIPQDVDLMNPYPFTTPAPTRAPAPNHVDLPWSEESSPPKNKRTKINNNFGHHHHHLQPLPPPHGETDDDGDDDGRRHGTAGRNKTRHHQITRSQQRVFSDRKRRDRLREKLRNLKELLPNKSSSKFDQATILDEAARRIKCLRSQLQGLLFSKGTSHHIAWLANHGYQSLQWGLMGQGLDMNYEMGFHIPSYPFLQLPSPMPTLAAPSMLISGVHSISNHSVPGECISSRVIPATLPNSYPGIIQGDWVPITSEIPQSQAARSIVSPDSISEPAEEVIPFPHVPSSLAASLPSKVSAVTSSVVDLPLDLGSQASTPLPQLGDPKSSPARTSEVGFSTSSNPIQRELGSQITGNAENSYQIPDTDQRPFVQDQFSATHFNQDTSLSSNMLEVPLESC